MSVFAFLMEERSRYFCWNAEYERRYLEVIHDETVIHHSHFTNKVIGKAHKRCNSSVQEEKLKVCNVYAHNARFDNKFVAANLELAIFAENYKVIPNVSLEGENSEQIKCIKIGQLHFKDSFSVFESSLGNLTQIKTEASKKECRDMFVRFLWRDKYLKKIVRNFTAEDKQKIDLVDEKGYYPYDYMDDIRKLPPSKNRGFLQHA